MPKRGRASASAAAASPDERPSARGRSSSQSSQSSQAQGKGAAQLQDLGKEIEERLVRSVFRVVMFSHTKRIAATRKEIKEAIGAEYQAPVLDHVIRQAQARFEALCGFRMVEVAAKGGKSYMLQASEELLEQVSESEQASFAPANDRDAAMAGLLAAVVGQIVLAKGGIKKDEFWSLLGEMGVKESDKDHPKLGNIKACMDNLKRQQYLDMVSKKNPVDRTTTVTFHLGARSKQELIRPKMRAFLDGQMGEALDDEDFEGLCDAVWPDADQASDEEEM